MNNDDLKEYVKTVYEMEVSVYQQKSLIEEAEKKISCLGRPTNYAKPHRPWKKKTIGWWLLSLVCAVTVFPFFERCFSWGFAYALEWMLTLPEFLETVVYIVAFILLFLGLCGVISGTFSNVITGIDYQTEKRAYQRERGEDKKRVKQEELQIALLKQELPALRAKYSESCALLNRIYGTNIIYHKYRGLIPVSSFYDYIMSGVCYQLEGPDGAYNKFDLESRLDKIITQLDVVIQKLDAIAQSQYMLYRGITESNNINRQLLGKVESLNDHLGSMESSAALAAHAADITSKELEYRNYMDRKYGRWD